MKKKKPKNKKMRKKTLQRKEFQKKKTLFKKKQKICVIKKVGDFTFAHFQRKMQGRNKNLKT